MTDTELRELLERFKDALAIGDRERARKLLSQFVDEISRRNQEPTMAGGCALHLHFGSVYGICALQQVCNLVRTKRSEDLPQNFYPGSIRGQAISTPMNGSGGLEGDIGNPVRMRVIYAVVRPRK